MIRGTHVNWTTASGLYGSGVVLSDAQDGHVFVAVDAPAGEEHRVIYCTVTWLTVDTMQPINLQQDQAQTSSPLPKGWYAGETLK